MGLFGRDSGSDNEGDEKSLDELRSELESQGGARKKSLPDDYGERKDYSQYPKDIINLSNRVNNSLYAKLIVPTKSSGATFTASGWNIGGDVVRRTTSKGTVEEEPWENYVRKLIVHEDHVEIGITYGDLSLTSDNRVNQTIRIDLVDIAGIRKQGGEGTTGFMFETAKDVYQCRLSRRGLAGSAKSSDASEAVRHLKNAVKNGSESEETEPESEGSEEPSEDDAIDKLSRIKELYDDGVITEEEFEDKKEDLLDEI
jgi:hypothetical protein